MLDFNYGNALASSSAGKIIIAIAIIMFGGFLLTRVTKLLKLPNVTGYILAGIILGPFCLNTVPAEIIDGMDFISDIALAFIAFSTGQFFKFALLKKSGNKIIIITVFEALLASLLIFILTFVILKIDLAFSIVLSALAAATAPASTIMTIRQTHAKGEFVDTLLQVIAIDNIIALLFYSVAISVAVAINTNTFSAIDILKPIGINLLGLALGGTFGFVMKLLITKKRSDDNKLIIALAVLFTFCGICALFDISPLLGCMAMGTIYINTTGDDKLFKQLNYFSPPLLLLFFVRSGLNFNLAVLVDNSKSIGAVSLLLVAILYFFVRIGGKYGGAFLGSMVAKKDKKIKNYLGFALIPQAGVAIGLAALGARTLGGEMGEALETIILASSVMYELVGPVLAKLSLYLSGSYSTSLEELVPQPIISQNTNKPLTEVELLIQRIKTIQETLPKHDGLYHEDEEAFLEAAEELSMTHTNKSKFINRRR